MLENLDKQEYKDLNYQLEKKKIRETLGEHLFAANDGKWSSEQMQLMLDHLSNEALEFVIENRSGDFYDEYTELAKTLFVEREISLLEEKEHETN